MAWCSTKTLPKPMSVSSYGVVRPQWVKMTSFINSVVYAIMCNIKLCCTKFEFILSYYNGRLLDAIKILFHFHWAGSISKWVVSDKKVKKSFLKNLIFVRQCYTLCWNVVEPKFQDMVPLKFRISLIFPNFRMFYIHELNRLPIPYFRPTKTLHCLYCLICIKVF